MNPDLLGNEEIFLANICKSVVCASLTYFVIVCNNSASSADIRLQTNMQEDVTILINCRALTNKFSYKGKMLWPKLEPDSVYLHRGEIHACLRSVLCYPRFFSETVWV